MLSNVGDREGLKLLRQGLNQSEVARQIKVCSQTVSRWAKTLEGEGRERSEGRRAGWAYAFIGCRATPTTGKPAAGRTGETRL